MSEDALTPGVPAQIEQSSIALAKNLLKALIDELIAANVWDSKSEQERHVIADRLSRRVTSDARIGYAQIMAGGMPHVTANLKKVVFEGQAIQGSLVIERNTDKRHKLADFAGCDVVIVMARDTDLHTDKLKELVEAAKSQLGLDLDEGEIEPRIMQWAHLADDTCESCNGAGEVLESADLDPDEPGSWIMCRCVNMG